MQVKDIVKRAAKNLGREDLFDVLDADGTAGEAGALIDCYNLVENEIALEYLPLKAEETFTPAEGGVVYTRFSHAPINVIKVLDERGTRVDFTLFPALLRLPEGVGTVRVQYAYAPAKKGLSDESEFTEKISERLLSYGVASEFCLMRGQYSEAAVWERKYREALRAACSSSGTLRIRARRWA